MELNPHNHKDSISNRNVLELQKKGTFFFLNKSKHASFFTNLDATGVVGSAWMRRCYPHSPIEKFASIKENFQFQS